MYLVVQGALAARRQQDLANFEVAVRGCLVQSRVATHTVLAVDLLEG